MTLQIQQKTKFAYSPKISILVATFNTKEEYLKEMIDRYKEYDCWLSNPYISEKLFTNLEDFLIDFKLLDNYVPFNDLVNNFYE